MIDESPSRQALRIVDFETGDGVADANAAVEPTRSEVGPSGSAPAYLLIERVVSLVRGDGVASEPEPLFDEDLRRWGRLSRLEPIGAGAWSRVYRAWDADLERRVALKLLRPPESASILDTSAIHASALREARNLARVKHPNVVTIYGAERHEDVDGIWMELVDGEDLDEMVTRSGPFSPEEACATCSTIAKALAAVHGAGLIHRDVKGANVMRERGGRIILMDFGVGAEDTALAAGRVSSGTGTPLYMAPEVLGGSRETIASDLYSLGVLLFFLLTGGYPIEAATVQELQDRHRASRLRSIRDLRSEVPDRVVAVCECLLDPSAERRYSSAGEASQAIQSAMFSDALAMHPTNSHSLKAPWIVVAVLVVALGASWAWQWDGAPVSDDTAGIRAITEMRRLTRSGTVRSLAMSPSGDSVAFLDSDSLHVMSVESEAVRFVGVWSGQIESWFPDGDAVLLSRRKPDRSSDLVRIDVDSGSETVLIEDAWGGDVSSDGRWLVYTSLEAPPRRGIWKLDMQTGREERIGDPDTDDRLFLSPRWSPSGEQLAFMSTGGWVFSLHVCDSDGGSVRAPVGTGSPIQINPGGSWTPDSKGFLLAGKLHEVFGVWKMSMDETSHVLLSSDWESDVSVSTDRKATRIATLRELDRSFIVLVDTKTGGVSEPFSIPQGMRSPSFSLDGRFLFAQVMVNGFWEVWRGNLESGRLDPHLSLEGQSCLEPVVSETGSILHLRADLRVTRRFGGTAWTQSLWETPTDLSENTTHEYAGVDLNRLPAHPQKEGRILYTLTLGHGQEALHVLRRDKTPQTILEFAGDFGFYAFDWGDSGNQILVSSAAPDERSFSSVSAIAVDTGERTRLFGLRELASADSTFSPAGSIWSLARSSLGQIAFLAPRVDGGSTLVVYDPSTRGFRQLHAFEERVVAENLSWSPDGRTVAIEVAESESDVFVGRLHRQS